MKLTANRADLLAACQIVGLAVPARTTMPVYQNIKAVAADGSLTLIGTDLEIGVRVSVASVAVQEPGEAVIPAARLTAILRESDGDEVTLAAGDSTVYVRTAAGKFSMPTDDPATFSGTMGVDGTVRGADLAAGDLSLLIRRTTFAAAKDEGKYAMRAVAWELADNRCNLIATDGKRLAIAGCVAVDRTEGDVPKPKSLPLVPPKAMSLVDRLLSLGDAAEPVRVSLGVNAASFETSRGTVTTRLVEGRFPPYREVIPKKFNTTVRVAAGPFLSTVRQAAIMSDAESCRVVFEFKAAGSGAEAQGATTGKSRVSYEVETLDGPAVTIAFDPDYLTEMLRVLDAAEPVLINLVDASKSAVFTVGDDYTHLIVPLV